MCRVLPLQRADLLVQMGLKDLPGAGCRSGMESARTGKTLKHGFILHRNQWDLRVLEIQGLTLRLNTLPHEKAD